MRYARPFSRGMEHGYSAYAAGCRCQVCREAKNAYVRDRRAQARRLAQRHTTGRRGEVGSTRHVADVAKHGTSYAYYERGCRCSPCTAYADQWAGWRRQQSREQVT